MEEILQGTDFPSLWKRVCRSAAPAAGIREENLYIDFINEAFSTAAFYGSLAKMFQNPGRGILLAQGQDCKNRCRILRCEYFLSSGIRYAPENHTRNMEGKHAALRHAVLHTQKQAEIFSRCAEMEISPVLQAMCRDFAGECLRHSREDHALLLECF